MPESWLSGQNGTKIFSLYSAGVPVSEIAKSHSPLRQRKESRTIEGRGYSFQGMLLSIFSIKGVCKAAIFISPEKSVFYLYAHAFNILKKHGKEYVKNNADNGINEEYDSTAVEDKDTKL